MLDTAFIAGTLALLALPGPTNALLFTAGATAGLNRAASLVASAVLGYVTASALLLHFAQPLLSALPGIDLVLRTVICGYLLMLSWTMWRQAQLERTDSTLVIPRRVFATTLLNPKCAVVALVLWPRSPAGGLGGALPSFIVLALTVAAVSMTWIAAGACASRAAPSLRRPAIYCRMSALAMLLFSGLLARSLVA